MPSALSYPGVYVEEIPSGVRTITGVATAVTAFVGSARKGPVDQAVDITSFADFDRTFGGLWNDSAMSFAVRDFFLNGGGRAVIVRLFHAAFADDAERQAAAAAVNTVATAAAAETTGLAAKTRAQAAFATINGDAAAKPAVKAAAKAANDSIAALADAADAAAVQKAVEAARALAPKATTRSLDVGTLKFAAASPGSWAGALRILAGKPDPALGEDAAQQLGVAKDDLFNLTVTDTAPGGASESYLNLTVKDSVRRVDKVLAGSPLLVWGGADLGGGNPPALPDFTTVFGDSVGQKYREMLDARRTNPDPTVDPLKKAQADYAAAVRSALQSTADGGPLQSGDFLKAGGRESKSGLFALEQLHARDGIFNLLCIPPYKPDNLNTANQAVDTGVIAAAGEYCEYRRAMLLVDAPPQWTTAAKVTAGFSADPDEVGYRGRNGALFFPRLRIANPLKEEQVETCAPCGAVAGIFARTDTQRGVWKSPAGLDASLLGVNSLSVSLTDDENGLLNPLGINCLRTFPVFGRVVWGARTLRGADAAADEYKYVAVRRTALFIEESLYRALKWVVFEPNDEPLWGQIRLNVGAFMHNLFRQGAFQGASARDAYFVRCDASTTTQNHVNLGVVNILVGFAPLKPAEFVVIKLQQMAGQLET
jgi:hypothetical protein